MVGDRNRSGNGPGVIFPHVVDEVQAMVAAQMDDRIAADPELVDLDHRDRRHLARSLINAELARRDSHAFADSGQALSSEDAEGLTAAVMNQMFGLSRIQDHLNDKNNLDIQINGYDNVWTETLDGRKVYHDPVADSDQQLIEIIQAEARRARVERTWSESNPFLDMALPGGARLNAVAWVSTRPSITIRRHNWSLGTMKAYFEAGGVSESLMWFLIAAVRGRLNIFVSGGTLTGKTTLARCMLNEIPPNERLLTVEDNLELGLSRYPDLHPNLIETEARRANLDGQGSIDMNALVRNGLRQSPDRIVIGEIRGGELIAVLSAMNSGHDGSIATIHASDTASIIEKLGIYGLLAEERLPVEATQRMAALTIHLFVQVSKLPSGRRCVTSVREVVGYDGRVLQTNEIYGQSSRAGLAQPLMRPTRITEQLEDAGFDFRWLEPDAGGWD